MDMRMVRRGPDGVRALMGTAILVVVLGAGSAGATKTAADHVTRGDMGLVSAEVKVSTMANPEACTARMGWRMGVMPE